MKVPLEYEGRNLKKAIQNAAQTLKIDADKLKYDVISYGSSGIFGLVGTKKARIRVIIDASEDPELKNTNTEPPLETAPEDNLEDKGDPQERESNDLKEGEPKRTLTSEEIETNTEQTEEIADAGFADTPPAHSPSWEESEVVGREVLQRLVDAITTGAEIVTHKKSNQIEYDVRGGNTAILIGKRGQTLEAIQYLVEKIVNKQRPDRIHIHIDAGDYMRKRRGNLEQSASRVANKAKRIGRPASLGLLNPHDRRIVHMALRSDEEVWTKSIGDGHMRKLVVYPKRPQRGEKGHRSR